MRDAGCITCTISFFFSCFSFGGCALKTTDWSSGYVQVLSVSGKTRSASADAALAASKTFVAVSHPAHAHPSHLPDRLIVSALCVREAPQRPSSSNACFPISPCGKYCIQQEHPEHTTRRDSSLQMQSLQWNCSCASDLQVAGDA